MGFLYFLATIALIALSWFIFWRAARIMTPNKINFKASELENANKLDFSVLARSLDTYISAVNTLNVRRLYNIMSDSFFHKTTQEIQGFQKVGIRKEISAVPLGGMEDGILTTDGKISWCTATLNCQYTEKYIDITTNQVLHTTSNPAMLTFSLSRSDHRERGQQMLCQNCGSPIGTNGEVYICSACGASYTSDSYDYIIAAYVLQIQKYIKQILF